MEELQILTERLKVLMTSAATDLVIDNQSESEYIRLRNRLLVNDKFRGLTPQFIITCSTLKEFRREMQSIASSYTERRKHIKDAFLPLTNTFFTKDDTLLSVEHTLKAQNDNVKALLSKEIIDKGKEMAEVYMYLYYIENFIRGFIEEVMKNNQIRIPVKVQNTINNMKAQEADKKYLPIRGNNDLYYCDFIQLKDIITGSGNWDVFKAYFPNQNEHWLNVMISELYSIRCLVAHNSYVSDHERRSLRVYYENLTLQLKI
jgi:hypothetical protein